MIYAYISNSHLVWYIARIKCDYPWMFEVWNMICLQTHYERWHSFSIYLVYLHNHYSLRRFVQLWIKYLGLTIKPPSNMNRILMIDRMFVYLLQYVILDKMFPNTAHIPSTVYPKKYAHGFVVLCFVVVMQSFITNSHEVFIHIHQGCVAGTGAIARLPQCQWS